MFSFKNGLTLVLTILLPLSVFAQKVTLSGYMRDAQSGESLISGTVYVKGADQGAQTNTYGFYSVSVAPGKYTVVYSYVGYTPIVEDMDLTVSKTFNAQLQSATV